MWWGAVYSFKGGDPVWTLSKEEFDTEQSPDAVLTPHGILLSPVKFAASETEEEIPVRLYDPARGDRLGERRIRAVLLWLYSLTPAPGGIVAGTGDGIFFYRSLAFGQGGGPGEGARGE